MARRNTRTRTEENPATDAPAEATSEAQEAQEGQEEAAVTATATEPQADETVETPETESAEAAEAAAPAPDESTTSGEGEAAEAEADPVQELLDLAESFMEHEDRDRQTGALPEVLVAKFGDAYRALDSGQKRQARNKITARVQELLDDEGETMFESVMKAKSFNLLITETKKSSPAAARPAATPVDPTEAYVDQYLALALATMALPVPEGVDITKAHESIQAIVGAYNTGDSTEATAFANYAAWCRNTDTENRGDEPEVPDYVKRSFKVADGKAAGTRRRASSGGGTRTRVAGGAQGDIAKHVAEVMAEVPVGEFKPIAWIAKQRSNEYGDRNPSAGAISARLFPSSGGPSTIPNIEGVSAEDSPEGKKGARRTA